MSADDEELAKDLGLLSALTIGIGVMIGAGIFVLPAPAAAEAGPAAAAAFVLGGMIAAFTALSISELGTAMPKAGGAYYYVNDALGPLFGSIAGWGNWIGLAAAVAFYLIGMGSYVAIFIPIPEIDLGVYALTSSQVIGLLAGLLFLGINYIGAKETGRVQIGIVLVLVAIVGGFTLVGMIRVDPTNLRPFAPIETGGWGAVFPATALVFVTYLGFAEINTAAEELKNPGRNLPIAVIGSLVFVTILYALVMMVVVGAVHYQTVIGFGDVAVARIAEGMLGPIGLLALTFAGVLATASSANASILASSRINFAMGRDGIVTRKLNEIHPRFSTPYRSIALTGALVFVFILVGDIAVLAKAGSVLHLIVYGLLNLALIVYRETDVEGYDPDFTIPLYPYVPIMGAILSFGLIAFMATTEILLSLLFIIFGIIWYAFYARNTAQKVGALARHIETRREELPPTVVSTAQSIQPNGGEFRVLVSLANPESQPDLVTIGCAIANQRDGIVEAIHILTVPDQTSLEHAAEHFHEEREASADLLTAARRDAGYYGVPFEQSSIFSHRLIPEIFDAARTHDADLVVMGWDPDSYNSAGRIESSLGDLTQALPCDFIAVKGRQFETERILVPTAGGPASDLSAEIAALFRREFGSVITLLHVNDDIGAGEEFLEKWAKERELDDVELRVESGDVDSVIKRAATEHSLVIIGATGRGILSRLVSGSSVLDAVEDADCSVLLSERPTPRSIRERLFGRRK